MWIQIATTCGMFMPNSIIKIAQRKSKVESTVWALSAYQYQWNRQWHLLGSWCYSRKPPRFVHPKDPWNPRNEWCANSFSNWEKPKWLQASLSNFTGYSQIHQICSTYNIGELTWNLESLVVSQPGSKASETVSVTVNMRCLSLLYAVQHHRWQFPINERWPRKAKREKENAFDLNEEILAKELTFLCEQKQVFDGFAPKSHLGPHHFCFPYKPHTPKNPSTRN